MRCTVLMIVIFVYEPYNREYDNISAKMYITRKSKAEWSIVGWSTKLIKIFND